MSSTNENENTLIPNEGTNGESENNNNSNIGSENSGENNSEDTPVTDKGGNGNTAANSGGTPHKGNRPKPNAGVGVCSLR